MNTTDSDEDSENEFDFDAEYDRVANILQEIKQDCRSHGTFLFEHTTATDFFMFMQYNPENPLVSYLTPSEEKEEAETLQDETVKVSK